MRGGAMLNDVLDYQIKAAACACAYLERQLDLVRIDCVAAWLHENRKHPKAGDVDSNLTLFRLYKDFDFIDDAEDIIERYATE